MSPSKQRTNADPCSKNISQVAHSRQKTKNKGELGVTVTLAEKAANFTSTSIRLEDLGLLDTTWCASSRLLPLQY
jgi:hypothetical protein